MPERALRAPAPGREGGGGWEGAAFTLQNLRHTVLLDGFVDARQAGLPALWRYPTNFAGVQLNSNQNETRRYSKTLGQAVFQGQIRDAFVSCLAENTADIRLLLFVEADDLRRLRWERRLKRSGDGPGNFTYFLHYIIPGSAGDGAILDCDQLKAALDTAKAADPLKLLTVLHAEEK